MDQAAVQEVNIHDGIENTLTMLCHKLKSVAVQRVYSDQLPRITTYASELNQVWTNLVDNAIDAMGGQGNLVIRTSLDYDHVVVEIGDDGPGVPSEIQTRIWEPFYTTKPVGEGLGLGLDTVYRVVVERQGGEVQLTSSPGDTRFTVRLPLAFAP
jgi:signal transduction histidine kinase